MEKFIQTHERNILGTLSCVDRIVYKGYLLFNKLHARGLIAKIPRSRRWRVTQKGWRVLGPLVEATA